MWRYLFIATYIYAGLFVGATAHQSYIDKCFENYYARSMVVILLWPLFAPSIPDGIKNECEAR